MITVERVPRKKRYRDDYRWEMMPPLWAAAITQWVFVGVWHEWFEEELAETRARNCPWAAAADAAREALRLLRSDEEIAELMRGEEIDCL